MIEEKPTLEQLIERAEIAKEEAFEAQLAYEQSLEAIASEYGSTYFHNQQWYQVRKRDSTKEGRKIVYLCELHAEPSTWLGKGKSAKKHSSVERAVDEKLK